MNRSRPKPVIMAAIVMLIGVSQIATMNLGCSSHPPAIKMATTTSTENSGLLKFLIPRFQQKTGILVNVIAVGTGKAIKHGENGDVDLILAHDRKAEDAFVDKGFGIHRKDVMYNDFVILGPASDPAGLAGCTSAVEALQRIAASEAEFISRGDHSGTHKKEESLWKEAGIDPVGKWYVPAGQGMGAALVMADEKQAHVLADRGTFVAYKGKTDLKILCQGTPGMINPYGIIAVNPDKQKHVKHAEAMEFINWIVSLEGQSLIASYRLDGKQLFFPNAK